MTDGIKLDDNFQVAPKARELVRFKCTKTDDHGVVVFTQTTTLACGPEETLGELIEHFTQAGYSKVEWEASA